MKQVLPAAVIACTASRQLFGQPEPMDRDAKILLLMLQIYTGTQDCAGKDSLQDNSGEPVKPLQ